MRGPHTPTVAWALAASLLGCGCLSTRDFFNPRTRVLENTAYTLAKHQTELGVSVLRTKPSELGAYVGAEFGVSDRVMGRLNLLHAANGLIGTTWKWNFLDTTHAALGASAGVSWLHADWLWALPEGVRDRIGDVDAIMVPVELLSSFPITHWLQLNLGLGYNYGQVVGPINLSDTAIDAGIGAHNLHIDPVVHIYLDASIALVAGAEISAWAASPQAIVAESTVRDGVRVGVRSGEWQYLPPSRLSRGTLSVEAHLGSSVFVRAGVTNGGLAQDMVGVDIVPFTALYWRTPQ
jgi:hypothetical protein